MARFERGNQFVELWTERPERPIDPATGDRPFVWPELHERRGSTAESVAPEKVTLRHAFSAQSEYRDRCADLLEQGWHRVRDPAREPATGDEPTDSSLDAQTIADPIATAPIYGDWLQQRGHPRGDLIAMQLAGLPIDAYLSLHSNVLLGDLNQLSHGDE